MAEEDVSVREWLDVVRRARLGRTVKGVAVVVATYADWSTGRRIYPGLATIAVAAEVDYKTAKKAIKELLTVGLLELVRAGARRRGGANEYRLVLAARVLDKVDVFTPGQFEMESERIRGANRRRTPPADRDPGSGSGKPAAPLTPTRQQGGRRGPSGHRLVGVGVGDPVQGRESTVVQGTTVPVRERDPAVVRGMGDPVPPVDNPLVQGTVDPVQPDPAETCTGNGVPPNDGCTGNGVPVVRGTAFRSNFQDQSQDLTSTTTEVDTQPHGVARASPQDPNFEGEEKTPEPPAGVVELQPARCAHGLPNRRRPDGTPACFACRRRLPGSHLRLVQGAS
jgi:hypothetical protein